MRGRNRSLGLAATLALAGVATAAAPDSALRYDGNNWGSIRGNIPDFYRITWLQMDDGLGHMIYDYRQDDVTFQFTAAAGATVEAVRLWLGNSHVCAVQPQVIVSIRTDSSGSPSGTIVGSSWSGGIGYWTGQRRNTEGIYDFPVGAADPVAGQVCHVRVTCTNIQSGSGHPGGGRPAADAPPEAAVGFIWRKCLSSK